MESQEKPASGAVTQHMLEALTECGEKEAKTRPTLPLPDYAVQHPWEVYSKNVRIEYRQCFDEGLDVEGYKALADAIAELPDGIHKENLAQAFGALLLDAAPREHYPYREPSTLTEIRNLRKPFTFERTAMSEHTYMEKLRGAWYGRIAGCLLGKPIEGIRRNDLETLLRASENYPLKRYLVSTDFSFAGATDIKWYNRTDFYADTVCCAPPDDDTNYTISAQLLIEKYGRQFKPADVIQLWCDSQPKTALCTAERVAFCNYVKGYLPPDTAVVQNVFREFIGAQIRGDYFGYINPGNPEAAAEMAFADASISHVKNGIYGEMFVSAMLAAAALTANFLDIVSAGLAQIPHTSRLYQRVLEIIDLYRSGKSAQEAFAYIHELYDEREFYDWCHTIPNAMIVSASLLYYGHDFSKAICSAVQAAFDTDCNGATVGSIAGMALGIDSIPKAWLAPLNGKLDSALIGVKDTSIDGFIAKTRTHAILKSV